MKVAVIIPYHKEPTEVLMRSYVSTVMQDYDEPVTPVLVADGYPNAMAVQSFNCMHISLYPCADYGDTPRAIGAINAIRQGYDAIAFLDADNWYQPDHIRLMAEKMAETGADVVTCPRNLYRPDESFMRVDDESDGINFNDTNCYLIGPRAFPCISAWLWKDKNLAVVGDRFFWHAIKAAGLKVVRQDKPTVNYTTTFAFHYQHNGEPVPPDSKVIVQVGNVMKCVSYTEFLEMSRGQQCQA